MAQVLEELTFTVQKQLDAKIPFCAFNGGNDVFVDVGNKSLGLEALMQYLGTEPVATPCLACNPSFADVVRLLPLQRSSCCCAPISALRRGGVCTSRQEPARLAARVALVSLQFA